MVVFKLNIKKYINQKSFQIWYIKDWKMSQGHIHYIQMILGCAPWLLVSNIAMVWVGGSEPAPADSFTLTAKLTLAPIVKASKNICSIAAIIQQLTFRRFQISLKTFSVLILELLTKVKMLAFRSHKVFLFHGHHFILPPPRSRVSESYKTI